MTNHLKGVLSVKFFLGLLMLCIGIPQAGATTIISNIKTFGIDKRYIYMENTNCTTIPDREEFFDPQLSSGAVVISFVVGRLMVDDGCVLGTRAIGLDDCDVNDLSGIDITSSINANGSFTMKLYDKTTNGPQYQNTVYLSGNGTVKYVIITNPLPPDITDTNIDEEVCSTRYNCEKGKDETVCWYQKPGCSSCNSRGSPQASFGIANFNVKVEDTPIWHETVVGEPLALKMRFSNYGESATNRTFGPKWSCNWNSSVTVLNSQTNRLVFQSGSIAFFTRSNNVYLPPDALEGVLIQTNGVYRYTRPDGWTWEYAPSEADTNVYLLSAVRDVWSNTVSVIYTNDRISRVTQSVPDSGRYLEFSYDGTNSRAISVSTEPAALKTASFSYSPEEWLTNVVDVAGYAYGYEYTNSYLSRVLKGASERLAVTYSALPTEWTATNSYWVQLADDGGFTRKYTWNSGVVREEVARGGIETVMKNYIVSTAGSRGRVLTDIIIDGVQQQYQYNAQGRVTSRTDRMGGIWNQTYNAQNNLRFITDPASNVTEYVYDTNGVDLLYVVPPTGPVQRVSSYVQGKPVVAMGSNALGQVTAYAYNSLGLVTNVYDGRMVETFAYDVEGRLTTRFRNGELVETNHYDSFGRLEWTRDAAGLEVSRTYDDLNRLTSQRFDNDGQISVHSNRYDCCFIDQSIDRDGNVWNYQYNDIGEKEWESNPDGLTTYYTYGVEGQPLSISNALQWTTRQYTPQGWLKTVAYPTNRPYDPAYHAENYWYDNEAHLTNRQTISGAFYKDEYDVLGRKTASYVPDASVSTETYVLAESNRYDALGRKYWSRDIRGLVVSNEFNALGQVSKTHYPDGSAEEWTYDAWGELTGFKNRAGNVESNNYDNLGRVVQRIDARQFSTYTVYTNADLVAVVSNSAGQVWRYAYDAERRVKEIIHPDSTVETTAYSPLGSVTQHIRGGITNVMTYNTMERRASVAVNGLLVESNRYDQLGQLVWSQNADGLVITNAWDSWGEMMSRHWPGGLQESYQYGDRGLTNTTDRLGIPVWQERDTLGRLTNQMDGATNALSYAYWSNGVNQLQFLWDGNSNQTAWAYDLYGNMTNKAYADNSRDRYQYDELNRLTNKLDAANVQTRYGYDAKGNLLNLEPGNDPQITFAYDGLNRRTNMADGVGTTSWTFDPRNHLTGETGPFGIAVATSYDTLGRMTNIGFSGYAWAYQYDALGRMTNIVAPEGVYRLGYWGQGNRKASLVYPNGVVAGMAYDILIRLTNLSYVVGASNRLILRYAYDADDRRTNEVWDSGRRMAYAYDRAHLLLGASSTNRASDNAAYRYDKAGNPLGRTESGLGITNGFNNLNQIVSGVWTGGTITVVGAVNYNAGTVTVNGATATRYGLMYEKSNVSLSSGTNVITAVYRGPAFTNTQTVATNISTVVVGSTTYGHDANGNLTNDANFVYQYDALNRLTNVANRQSGSSVLANRYDGLGRRVEAVRNGTNTERYVYFPGSFLVLAVLDGSNDVKEVFTHGPDMSGTLDGAGGIGGIFSQTTGTNTHYLHPDAMGNIVLTTDASGQTSSTYHYTPFGKLISKSGPFDCRYAFSSKEWETQAGLYYYGYRFYSPNLGRWLNRDPLSEYAFKSIYQRQASLSERIRLLKFSRQGAYRFLDNCPLSRIDPEGLQWYEPILPGEEPQFDIGGEIGDIIDGMNSLFSCIEAIVTQATDIHAGGNHCVVSCELGRGCGTNISLLLGLGWEAFQYWNGVVHFWSDDQMGELAKDSILDLLADIDGNSCVQSKMSCECCCKGNEQ